MVHRDSKIRPEGVGHPTRLVALPDGLVHPLLQCHGPLLSLKLEISLRLQLRQELAGLLTSHDILLQQLVSLLLEPSDLLLIQLHPRRQILKHRMELLDVTMRLGLPPLDDSKLRAHISSQPGLLGEAVSFRLLLTEELGFVPATSNDTLKRRPV